MVGNVWLDRNSGELTYNIEDPRYPVLSKDAGVDKSTEVDPTQKTARSDGRSPARILVSTFSEYPPRQKPASFSLDKVMEKLTDPGGAT